MENGRHRERHRVAKARWFPGCGSAAAVVPSRATQTPCCCARIGANQLHEVWQKRPRTAQPGRPPHRGPCYGHASQSVACNALHPGGGAVLPLAADLPRPHLHQHRGPFDPGVPGGHAGGAAHHRDRAARAAAGEGLHPLSPRGGRTSTARSCSSVARERYDVMRATTSACCPIPTRAEAGSEREGQPAVTLGRPSLNSPLHLGGQAVHETHRPKRPRAAGETRGRSSWPSSITDSS